MWKLSETSAIADALRRGGRASIHVYFRGRQVRSLLEVQDAAGRTTIVRSRDENITALLDKLGGSAVVTSGQGPLLP